MLKPTKKFPIPAIVRLLASNITMYPTSPTPKQKIRLSLLPMLSAMSPTTMKPSTAPKK